MEQSLSWGKWCKTKNSGFWWKAETRLGRKARNSMMEDMWAAEGESLEGPRGGHVPCGCAWTQQGRFPSSDDLSLRQPLFQEGWESEASWVWVISPLGSCKFPVWNMNFPNHHLSIFPTVPMQDRLWCRQASSIFVWESPDIPLGQAAGVHAGIGGPSRLGEEAVGETGWMPTQATVKC